VVGRRRISRLRGEAEAAAERPAAVAVAAAVAEGMEAAAEAVEGMEGVEGVTEGYVVGVRAVWVALGVSTVAVVEAGMGRAAAAPVTAASAEVGRTAAAAAAPTARAAAVAAQAAAAVSGAAAAAWVVWVVMVGLVVAGVLAARAVYSRTRRWRLPRHTSPRQAGVCIERLRASACWRCRV